MTIIHDDAIAALSLDHRPYFAARVTAQGVETEGVPSCSLGQRIPVSGSDLDDGVFLDWQWDGERLTVRNDRYGLYPLFYSNHGGSIRVSPAITHVLKGDVPRELDYQALAVLLRLGHFVGEDTPFLHVRFLPPNSTLTWQNGALEIRQRPLEIGNQDAASLSFDDAVDQYIALFHQAVERRLPDDDNFTVPLSGGRDSRHILFALDHFGYRPKESPTVKYRPPATNEDLRIARLLCQEFGIEHITLEKAPSWQQAVLKDIQLTNFCGGGHAWILPVAAYLNGRVTTMYDGLAGSVLSGGFMADERKLKLVGQGRLPELAGVLFDESGKEGFNRTVLRGPFAEKASRSIAVDRVTQELERHQDARNPLLSFIFWNRTRRTVASIPYSILSCIPVVQTPYLDHAVFDFLTHVNPSYFLGNRLHDAAIKRAYPQYAHIPYEDSTRRAQYQPEDHAYFRQALKEFWRYLWGRGPHRPSEMIRREYIYPRTLYDLCKRKNTIPWYLMTTLYALELEKLRDGG